MEKAKLHNKPFRKLYNWIRDFDVYKGYNPLKLLLRHLACRMWDFQEDRDFDMYFLNKRKTQINYIGFPRYLLMSLFYKTEYTSQRRHRLAAYIPTKDLPKGLRIEIVVYDKNDVNYDARRPNLSLFPYNHKDRDGFENSYDLITRIRITDKKPQTIEDIETVQGFFSAPIEYKNAVLQWANEGNNWNDAKIEWFRCANYYLKPAEKVRLNEFLIVGNQHGR